MSDNDSIHYPKPNAADHAYSSLKLMVGCIAAFTGPAGALAQLATDRAMPSPLEQRREAFFNALADGLRELQQRGVIDVADIVIDPAFVSATIEASETALKNHSRTKLDALRNAILNCAIAKADDDSKRRTFLRFVDELSDGHILTLELFQNPQQWFVNRNLRPRETHITSSLDGLLGDAFPQMSGQRDFTEFIVTELHNRKLINVSASNLFTMMSAGGSMAKRTTEFGDAFLAFISAPVP